MDPEGEVGDCRRTRLAATYDKLPVREVTDKTDIHAEILPSSKA